MIFGPEYDLFLEGIKVLFLIGVPVTAVIGIAGIVAGIVQGSTTIKDPAIGYAFRLGAFIILASFMLSMAIELIVSLARMVLE